MGYPGKGRADHLELGDWNAQCYQCGRKRKASTLMRHWQGYWVCPEHWEARHPQDFVRGVPDVVTPPWTQPWPQDAYAINVVNLGPDDSGTYTLPATASGAVIINILEGCSITSLDLSAGTAAVTSVVVNVGGSLGPVTLAGVGGGADPEINVQDGGEYDPSIGDVFFRSGNTEYSIIDWDGTLRSTLDASAKAFSNYPVCGSLGETVVVQNASYSTYAVDATTLATLGGPVSLNGVGGGGQTASAVVANGLTGFVGAQFLTGGGTGEDGWRITLNATLGGAAQPAGTYAFTSETVGSNVHTHWQAVGGYLYCDPGDTPAYAVKLKISDATGSHVVYSSGIDSLNNQGTKGYNLLVNQTKIIRCITSAGDAKMEVCGLSTGTLLATLTCLTPSVAGSYKFLLAACDDDNLLTIVKDVSASTYKAILWNLTTYAGTDITATMTPNFTLSQLETYALTGRAAVLNLPY